MRGHTHLMAGVCIGLVGIEVLQPDIIDSSLLLGASIIGSILPDICHPSSTIGRKAGFLSKIIHFIFGHRTITHSLFFLLLVSFLSTFFFPNPYVTRGLLLGIVSHLLLDAFTAQGIKLFYPLQIKIRFPLYTKTGSLMENILFAALMVTSCLIGYNILLTTNIFI